MHVSLEPFDHNHLTSSKRAARKMQTHWFAIAALLLFNANTYSRDTNFWVFLCFGQSNMEGFPGIDPADKEGVDPRFQVLAAVDFPKLDRKKGNWYSAVAPLCRPSAGLGPADYFGRTLVSNLPPNIKVGIVNVSLGGCKIELFEKDTFQAYAAKAPVWMTNTIALYSGNPYQHLVEMAKLAQKDGAIKGILLHQGESNTNDKEWPKKVKGIYDNLIEDLKLKAEEVPLLTGELVNADQKGACASMNTIIGELPRTIPNSHVISSAGCPSRPDHLHFTAAGYRELGTRYAEKVLHLLGYKLAEREALAAPAPGVSRTAQAKPFSADVNPPAPIPSATMHVIVEGDSPAVIAEKAAKLLPRPNQTAWMRLERTFFLQFGVNTFNEVEWGSESGVGRTTEWTTNLVSGRFDNIQNNPSLQEVSFAPVRARYFRFTALRSIWNSGWTSAAEISVLPASGTAN